MSIAFINVRLFERQPHTKIVAISKNASRVSLGFYLPLQIAIAIHCYSFCVHFLTLFLSVCPFQIIPEHQLYFSFFR